jgi:hypothetical protein
MIVVLQIVINNGFYCRKSYRLLKRRQNSTLSAIFRRDIMTRTLICPRNRPSIVKIHAIVNPQLLIKPRIIPYTAAIAHVLTSLQLFICHLADDKFVLQSCRREGNKVFLFTKLLLRTLSKQLFIKIYYHCGHSFNSVDLT